MAFELEESVDCAADYVVIRDGKDKSAPLIGKKGLKQTNKQTNKQKFSSLILNFLV